MKSASSGIFLLAVVLGAVSAGVTSSLLVTSSSMGSGREPDAGAVGPEDRSGTTLASQIEGLRDENRALRKRVQALEIRPAPALRVPVGAAGSNGAVEELVEEVRARMASAEATRGAPPELRVEVEKALGSIREGERLEAERLLGERQAQRIEQRLSRLTSKLDLSPYQVGEMRTLLTTKAHSNEELKRRWEEGVDGETLGAEKQANDEEHESALERILTPEQLETYRASDGGK